jgi:hypothetical protein
MRLTIKTPLFVGVVTIAAGLGDSARAQSQPVPIAERIIFRNVTLNLPLGPCDAPNLLIFLAKDVAAPAGAEQLPGSCGYDVERPPITDRIPLVGKRFGEALELLARYDPRYHVIEADGIVVMRPMEAWINDKHFLHATIDKLELTDENIGGALDAVLAPFGSRSSPDRAQSMSGVGKLTLSIGPITVVEALDAIVRTHGSMRWVVSYCLPEVAPDVAMLFFHTYDDRGLGAPVSSPRRRVNGKPVSCGINGAVR